MDAVKEKGMVENIEKVLAGSRTFEVLNEAAGTSVKYYVVMPTAEEARQGQWEYTKAYNRALVEGVFTSDEMLDILKKRNITGDKYEARLEKLRIDIQERMVEMELSEDKEEKRTKALEVEQLREDIFQWNNRVAGPMNNTAEQLSADARIDYFTSTLVRDDKGEKVWDSEADYLRENDQFLSIKSRMEVMMWLEGLDSDMLDNTPEQVVLRELEAAELDEVAKDLSDADDSSTPAPEISEAALPVPEPAEEEKGEAKAKPVRKKKTTRRQKKQ